MVWFIVWELRAEHPLVNLRVFANRNFAVGTLLITIVGVVLYSTTALLPLFLQGLMGYPALNSGMAVSPRGLGAVIAMLVVGRLVGKIDTRVLIAFGFGLLAYSTRLFAKIDLDIATVSVTWPNILSGVAMGFVFVPLTVATMGELSQRADGQRHGDLQPDAEPGRQHRHLAGHHPGRPRRPDPPGDHGGAPHPLRHAVAAIPA